MKLKRPPKAERKSAPPGRFSRFTKRLIVVVVILLLFALAALQLLSRITGNSLLAEPGSRIAQVVTPIQTGFSAVVDWATEYLRTLKLRSRIELEYNNLRQENEQLIYDAMLAEELQHKLSVYEDMFNEISVNESMNPLPATVIGRESGNYFSVFTINKGSNDGVQDFMAVTSDGALVGYTYNVTPTKSTVRTIIDSEASIAALISSSRDQGTVRGTLGVDGTALCRMYYLPEDNLPRPGDLVVTSGVGMSFPKGIPIGEVRESTRGMESNKQFVVIQPRADFEHIEYVLVLRYQPRAEDVQDLSGKSGSLSITPLDTVVPVPTVQIGDDFYQLAPTPEPTPEPTPVPSDAEGGEIPPDGTEVTPMPPAETDGSYQYQIPTSPTDAGYSFTLPPTATPTPSLPPLDLDVEED